MGKSYATLSGQIKSSIATVTLVSCATTGSRTTLDVALHNGSTNQLDWVALSWDEAVLRAGVLPPGVAKTILSAGMPQSSTSDTAILEFVEDSDAGHRHGQLDQATLHARPRHKIRIDISRLKHLSPSRRLARFSILSYEAARLKIEQRGK